jgi:hypothetical protein
VIDLRFWHSLGLLQGNMTVDNVSLDEDVVIQVTTFYPNRLMKPEGNGGVLIDVGGSSEEY